MLSDHAPIADSLASPGHGLAEGQLVGNTSFRWDGNRSGGERARPGWSLPGAGGDPRRAFDRSRLDAVVFLTGERSGYGEMGGEPTRRGRRS